MLTPEQTKAMKTKLIQHIENSFPEDKKEFAISQIESMDSEQLEEFLIKNKLMKKGGTSNSIHNGQCVFCSIVSGEINSYKIAENSKAVAVLEINPVSNGHVIIIPKEHIASEKQLPEQIPALSKKVSSMIKKRLKPKKINIENSNILGHEILNVIPVYDDVDSGTERKHANPEELSELQEILTKRPIARKSSGKRKTIFEEKIWLPKRIP